MFSYKNLYYCLNARSGFLIVWKYMNETKISLMLVCTVKTKTGCKLEFAQS